MNSFTKEKDILLAEDDKEDVLIFEAALKDLNFEFELRHAPDGEALFVLLMNKKPYILFLDIHMPCKDGVACISEIRKNREYDNLPVIMYTSHLSTKFVDECFQNGANFYLEKSTTFNTLRSNLQKIFSIDWANFMHFPPRNNFLLS